MLDTTFIIYYYFYIIFYILQNLWNLQLKLYDYCLDNFDFWKGNNLLINLFKYLNNWLSISEIND